MNGLIRSNVLRETDHGTMILHEKELRFGTTGTSLMLKLQQCGQVLVDFRNPVQLGGTRYYGGLDFV